MDDIKQLREYLNSIHIDKSFDKTRRQAKKDAKKKEIENNRQR